MTEPISSDAVVMHTAVAIGRTGAESLEIGYLDDEPPHRWWATAQYRGAKVSCDEQPEVAAALLGLYAIVAAGGQCTRCERTIAIKHLTVGLVDGARMREGQFQSRVADQPAEAYCVRRLEPDGWTGCRR